MNTTDKGLPELPAPWFCMAGAHISYTADQMRAMYEKGKQDALSAASGKAEWPRGVLNQEATIRTLSEHNAWRRGVDAAEQPQGEMVLVPREPTDEMLDAAMAAVKANTVILDAGPAKGATLVRDPHYHAYRAMLSAAPSRPVVDGGKG